jgi:glutaminyl-peptide cyclotransferase
MASSSPLTPKLLVWALGVQLVIGGLLVWQAATGFSLFRDDGSGSRSAPAAVVAADAIPVAHRNWFNGAAALDWARRQVDLGPRPAGSDAQRQAAEMLRPALPNGRFVDIGGGLRNIVGTLPGTGRPIVIAAHYDTTPVPGYVGANNSAAGVGAVIELGRALRRHPPRSGRPVQLLLTDGEEAPEYPVSGDFATQGLRGSRFAARGSRAGDVIVLDFVAQKGLRIAREAGSDRDLWAALRRAAKAVGVASVFPGGEQGEVIDDHTPFASRGIRAIDLIDFDYPCWQKPCDTLDQLDVRALDAVGETVLELVRTLR